MDSLQDTHRTVLSWGSYFDLPTTFFQSVCGRWNLPSEMVQQLILLLVSVLVAPATTQADTESPTPAATPAAADSAGLTQGIVDTTKKFVVYRK